MHTEDLHQLREREKELNCIYRIIQILKREDLSTSDIMRKVVVEIPAGWRYPGICMASIDFEGHQFTTPHFYPTKWYQSAELVVDEKILGEIRVYYTRNVDEKGDTLFLPEEQHLLNTIAEQVSVFIFNRRLKRTLSYLGRKDESEEGLQVLPVVSDKHWRWRYKMARLIADGMDLDRMGVVAVYLIGSTKDAKAGPASDLDLLVHFTGDAEQKMLLRYWIDGWSRCLTATNYERTGYHIKGGMIDLHVISSAELKDKKSSFAAMIGSIDNSAWLLRKKAQKHKP